MLYYKSKLLFYNPKRTLKERGRRIQMFKNNEETRSKDFNYLKEIADLCGFPIENYVDLQSMKNVYVKKERFDGLMHPRRREKEMRSVEAILKMLALRFKDACTKQEQDTAYLNDLLDKPVSPEARKWTYDSESLNIPHQIIANCYELRKRNEEAVLEAKEIFWKYHGEFSRIGFETFPEMRAYCHISLNV